MTDHYIIHISREHGSLGELTAKKLAEELGCPFYGNNILTDIATEAGIDPEFLRQFEEMPKVSALYRFFDGRRSTLKKELQEQVVEYIDHINKVEDRAVILGRNAGNILERQDDVINIFIVGNLEDRIANIMKIYELDRDGAIRRIREVDKFRKKFHETHTKTSWQKMDSYDLIINTSKTGVDGAVKVIRDYLEQIEV
ncbi:MAG: cytidylate kinase-like family protein [Clostridia bacterium]|nr:cytidylate kinase-like family protein [Clostridia bacterium]